MDIATIRSKGELIQERIHIALLSIFAVVFIIRSTYSLDFTDESYFIALIDWMTKGARPFIDIWAMHQTSAILLVPVQWVINFF